MKKYKIRPIIIWIVIIMAGIFLVNNIKPTQLTERCFAISLGIDILEDDEFFVSCEVAIPSGNAGESGGGKYKIIHEKGKTISEAFDLLKVRTGLVVSGAHCNIVILGKNIVEKNQIPILANIVSSWWLPEQAIVVLSSDSALSLQRSHSQMASSCGEEIVRALLNNGNSVHFVTTKLKNFIMQYYYPNGSTFITRVSAQKSASEDNNIKDNESEKKSQYIYDYSTSCVLNKYTPPLVLDQNETMALSLVMDKVDEGKINCLYKGNNIELSVNNVSNRINVGIVDSKARVDIKVEIECDVVDSRNNYYENSLTNIDKQNIERIMGDKINNEIIKLYDKTKNSGHDVFLIYDRFNAFYGKKWQELVNNKGNYLSDVEFTSKVKISLVK